MLAPVAEKLRWDFETCRVLSGLMGIHGLQIIDKAFRASTFSVPPRSTDLGRLRGWRGGRIRKHLPIIGKRGCWAPRLLLLCQNVGTTAPAVGGVLSATVPLARSGVPQGSQLCCCAAAATARSQGCSYLRGRTPGFPGPPGRGEALPGFLAWASGMVLSPTRAPKWAKAASEGRPDDRKGPRADERSL